MTSAAEIAGSCAGLGIGVLAGLVLRESTPATVISSLVTAFFGYVLAVLCQEKKFSLGHILIIWASAIVGALVLGYTMAFLAGPLGPPIGMIGGASLGVWVVNQLARKPVFEAGHCPTCGYDVHGLREDRCPECGNRFDFRQVFGHPRTPE